MSDTPHGGAPPRTSRIAGLKTDTEYERVFADRVLDPLAELSSWTVEAQKSISINGQTYRPDFVLTLTSMRIAIEIDGKDKGPGSTDHDAWTRRQTALVNAGWEVLRFTNRQVMHEQEYCRRQIAVAVARVQERDHRPAPASPSSTPAPPRPTAPVPPPPSPAASSKTPLIALGVGVLVAALAGAVWASSSGGGAEVQAPGADGFPCPASQPVKGNVSQTGERIYHQRGDAFYDRTAAEECFSDPGAAEAAGYRAARR